MPWRFWPFNLAEESQISQKLALIVSPLQIFSDSNDYRENNERPLALKFCALSVDSKNIRTIKTEK